VSAPFHCALMQPAADAMAKALSDVKMHVPAVPLVANILASQVTDPAIIRQKLVEQVTGTVRWRESVGYMVAQGVKVFVEIGAGKVLTGLSKKNSPDALAVACGTPEDIAAAAAHLKQG
jgi:[acyl-carrier-protein] S-malonyltransferase